MEKKIINWIEMIWRKCYFKTILYSNLNFYWIKSVLLCLHERFDLLINECRLVRKKTPPAFEFWANLAFSRRFWFDPFRPWTPYKWGTSSQIFKKYLIYSAVYCTYPKCCSIEEIHSFFLRPSLHYPSHTGRRYGETWNLTLIAHYSSSKFLRLRTQKIAWTLSYRLSLHKSRPEICVGNPIYHTKPNLAFDLISSTFQFQIPIESFRWRHILLSVGHDIRCCWHLGTFQQNITAILHTANHQFHILRTAAVPLRAMPAPSNAQIQSSFGSTGAE